MCPSAFIMMLWRVRSYPPLVCFLPGLWWAHLAPTHSPLTPHMVPCLCVTTSYASLGWFAHFFFTHFRLNLRMDLHFTNQLVTLLRAWTAAEHHFDVTFMASLL